MRHNDDKENLYEIGTEESSDIPIMQKTADENAEAFSRLLKLRRDNPLPSQKSLVHEAALRSNGSVQGNSGAQASINDDLSRFDDALKNTAR